jgi:type II secretion system protein I
MSLLEVLVALAIFIMALAALGQLVQLGLEQAVEAERQTTAVRLAQSQLAEIEAGSVGIDGGSGEFTDQELKTDGTPLWKWEALSVPTATANVYDVTVTISLTTGEPFTLTLSQLIFDPAYLSGAAPTPTPVDPNAVPPEGDQ